jgi:hypothetical protein
VGVFLQETGAAGQRSFVCFYMPFSSLDFLLTIEPISYLLKTAEAILDAIMEVRLEVNAGGNNLYEISVP